MSEKISDDVEIISCPDCGGYGYEELQFDGGEILRFGCNTCNGSGAIQVKKEKEIKNGK